jgi:hypothetical protein
LYGDRGASAYVSTLHNRVLKFSAGQEAGLLSIVCKKVGFGQNLYDSPFLQCLNCGAEIQIRLEKEEIQQVAQSSGYAGGALRTSGASRATAPPAAAEPRGSVDSTNDAAQFEEAMAANRLLPEENGAVQIMDGCSGTGIKQKAAISTVPAGFGWRWKITGRRFYCGIYGEIRFRDREPTSIEVLVILRRPCAWLPARFSMRAAFTSAGAAR